MRHNFRRSLEEYSLDNIKELASYLGSPQDQLKVVHLAGTSGKTSTAYYMESLLAAAGQKTGLAISPHVDEINERVQLNGQPLSETEFCQALAEFVGLVEPSGIHVSWFEVLVAFAYWYFVKAGVDYAVVEVGLGGLLDGTNLVSRADKVCVITDIGLDHTEILGETLPEIATQKAGIIMNGNPVFCYRQAPEAMQVIESVSAKQAADLHVVEPGQLDGRLPKYQLRNFGLALEVYRFLAGRDGLPKLSGGQVQAAMWLPIPGRMETRWVMGKTLILDGAHNPQKMAAFVSSFKQLYPDTKPAVLIGLKPGKDLPQIADSLKTLASRVITTGYQISQDLVSASLDPNELARAFTSQGLATKVVPQLDDALKELLGGPEEVCVVTGSLYLLGHARRSKLLA